MTIIAYRDGVISADSQITSYSGVITSQFYKLSTNSDGWLGGGAGDIYDISAFRGWVNKGCKKTFKGAERDNFEAILVDPDGFVHVIDKRGILAKDKADYYASGSGAQVALGAMAHGASAIEAVHIAIKLITTCGGEVCSLRHVGFMP